MKTMRRRMRQESGQGMTEYIIIVALIAISCICVVTVFGDNIRKMFGSSVDALANSATSDTNAAKAGDLSNHKNIANFANHHE
jgi:pilus assembly protein Flp/PilA